MTVRDAGDSALLLQLEPVIDPAVNARAIAIAAAVRARALRGVRDVVSTYRSVAVYFDPLIADVDDVRRALERAARGPLAVDNGAGRTAIEIPVLYGGDAGPDLAAVATFGSLTPQEVIALHTAPTYRVFMLGFLPGFPYMATVAPPIAMPRHVTPRVRVPGGAVGIAGAQTGIYPIESPGGWQIIGRTAVTLFDPRRTPSAMLSPGDRVRFVVGSGGDIGPPEGGPYDSTSWRPASAGPERLVTVLKPGLFTTIQDGGRWGHQGDGVPVSGAMDAMSHRIANAVVGNDDTAAALEVTLVGPELRFAHDTTIAVGGADLSATVDGTAIPLHQAVPCRAGSVMRFGERRTGARAYVAFNGGLDTPRVMDSRATHVRSRLGGFNGRALAAGDELPLGAARTAMPVRVHARSASSGGARVRVLAGPQEDSFPSDALHVLQRTRFTIAPQSDRMGYRLQGWPVPRRDNREMISDATFTGSIQVPPSGEPILLMADRQTTGGYPQIAIVITADLPLAAQLAPGDWIEFQLCTSAEAREALRAQQGAVRAT